ncbi:MAG TPA: exosortase O, partial [Cyanobacteria bacterium UBA8543]|nr:exosortase O [Cyanobacteria bacterium UBA8543]
MRVSIRPDRLALTDKGSTYILVAAWIYANLPSLKWLFESLRQVSRLNLLVVGFIVVVLLVQIVRSRRREGLEFRSYLLSTTPVLQPYPLLLMVGSGLSAIALQWLVDIEQLTILLFLLGTYGLCGLFLTPSAWRKGLPLVSIVACLISFSSQVGIGLGMPARIITAHAVEHLLSTWHIAAISSYDIIVLENGVAHVDIPCSGLKSLGTGTLFLLAATWLEGRKLGVRWLLVCLTNLFLLVCANTIRVLLLVVITH